VSDSSGAWYHCTRCGSLFKAAADPGRRGCCPDCGGDPSGDEEPREPAGPVRVRRKIRKKHEGKSAASSARRESKGKARALLAFVVAWMAVLGAGAVMLKRKWPTPEMPADSSAEMSAEAMEDQRLIQDELEGCGKRLTEFLAAADIGTRAQHVLGSGRTVARMARVQQFNPANPLTEGLAIEEFRVIHTPLGRAIETLWKTPDGERIEAVFFEEDGEWKIDWDAFARAGTESWPLFLAGRGPGEGEFRVLARERISSKGPDERFIGLVLYAPRFGRPKELIAPSPEIRVERDSPMGRQIEEAFAARRQEIGPFGSGLVKHDPDDMIRLRVRIRREDGDERVFLLDELIACHWLQLDGAE
jgi:predicted  nucleic acid-binding Zn-ribbon protein